MPLFNWDESYSVGVDSIDLQHKNLFDMINNLHDNIHSIKNEPLAIKTTLDELISYIQYHFLHEEELLKKNNFPEFQVHSIEHEKLCGNLEEFIKKFQYGQLQETTELLKFMIDWLQFHILKSDMKYKEFLKGKKS